MAVPSSTLVEVLTTLTASQKLDRLALLCPADAAGIELIIDDCLERRWPRFRPWPRAASAGQRAGHSPAD